MHSDEYLIDKAAKGDKAAFSELVNRYKGYVFAIVLKFVLDKTQAENIAQDTFIQAYVSLSKYKHGGFKSWIGRIAVNKAIDWQRKTSKETLVDMQTLAPQVCDDNNPEEQLVIKQEKEQLKTLFNQLPIKYKNVLKEFYFADKSYKQIATETGLSEKTIQSQLYRARKLLRKNWREER